METQTIDEMILALGTARQSMERQSTKVHEIVEKSDNILLQIETKCAQKTNSGGGGNNASMNATDQMVAYNTSSETEQTFAKIIEQTAVMLQNSAEGQLRTYSQLDGCTSYRQRVDYLSSGVRKLIALCNSVGQMENGLRQQHDHADEDDGEEDTDISATTEDDY